MINEGNQFGVCIKDPKVRQEAYLSFCEHIARGKPMKAWHFKKGKHHCSWETMQKWCKEFPNEFDPNLKQQARSQSYLKWFDRGEAMSDGLVKGNYSPNTWNAIMRNMFDWDKEEKDKTSKTEEVEFALQKSKELDAKENNHIQPKATSFDTPL